LFAGQVQTPECKHLMQTFKNVCFEMDVPLNKDKTDGPTTCLIFLGLEIDTVDMQIRIPIHKVYELVILQYWVSKNQA
jgi:hypothetical protein